MRIIIFLVFAVSMTMISNVFAQTSVEVELQPASSSPEEFLDSTNLVEVLREALRNADAQNQVLRAQVAQGSIRTTQENSESFAAVLERYNKSWIDYYDHENLLRAHARAALAWQLIAASVVLVLVVTVAGLGVFLSYREVMASLQAPRDAETNLKQTRNVEAKNAEEAQAVAKQQTELVLSFQKMQLTSAVTGVIILGLSLGFLFLFLQSVFGLDPQDFSTAAEPKSEQTVPTTQEE